MSISLVEVPDNEEEPEVLEDAPEELPEEIEIWPYTRGEISETHELRLYKELNEVLNRFMGDPDRQVSVPGALGILGMLKSVLQASWLNQLVGNDDETD
jgi:hypothetical protein